MPWFAGLLALSLAVVLGFLALPVVAIFVHTSPGRLIASLGEPASTEALRLSFETSALALAAVVLVGTPSAYLLARSSFPGKALLTTVIELPLVLPPAVAGIALLVAFGPHGILGGLLASAHVRLVLQTAGVVVALAFVSSPLYLRQAQAAFAAIDRVHLDASRTLGSGPGATFVRVALPLAAPGLLTGAVLAWGRALGEFGATLLFAGSFQGVTQTAPLAIYSLVAVNEPGAIALAVVLVIVSAVVLLSAKLILAAASSRHAR